MSNWFSLLTAFMAAATQGLKAFTLWTQSHLANQIAALEDRIYEIEAAAEPDAALRADRLRLQLTEKRRLLDLVQPAAPAAASGRAGEDNGGDLHPAN